MKKIIKCLLCLSLVFAMVFAVGCTGDTSQPPDAEPAPATEAEAPAAPADTPADTSRTSPYKVGMSVPSATNTYGVQVLNEAEYAMESSPDVSDFYIVQADNNAAKQVADIEDMLAQGVDLLLIQAVNEPALVPVVQEAMNSGVIVISVSGLLEEYDASVASQDFEFGRIGAQWLADTLDGSGNIIVFDGIAGLAVAENRLAGAMSVFDNYPDMQIVGSEFASWDFAQGKMAAENMLAANPVIDGVWSCGGEMTRGAIEAFQAAKRPLIPMMGEDCNGFLKDWKSLIDDPGFDAIATSMPTWIFSEALDIGLKILNGESVEKDTIIPIPVITKDNLDDFIREDLSDAYWANSRMSEEMKLEIYGL